VHPLDKQLSDLERAQHGLVSIDQLTSPWTPASIRHRVRARRRLVACGVLANPSVVKTFEQRVLAAVLAAGDLAFASHETAAALWKLPLPAPALLEVTTPMKRRPRVRGVRMHRSGLLDEIDVMIADSIPRASPELTIYSLSSRCNLKVLGRMSDDAVRRQLTTYDRLAAIVERLPAAPGRSRRKMSEVLGRRLPGIESRESLLEDFVFAALVRFRLPVPVPQYEIVIDGQLRRIDLCYPDDRLALEAKGFQWYRTRSGWDRDQLRGNELQLAGFRVLSFTSAFTDWQIAVQVAEALQLPAPAHGSPQTFSEWCRTL
jgi:hypothetical protein